jgi:hypothetical protein
MPWRGECFIDGTKVVVGFRSLGQASLFCGADPVFQFNEQRELRRAYHRGIRFRAENGSLVAMTRPSRGGKLTFETRAIERQTESQLFDLLRTWIAKIRQAIDSSSWRVEGESSEAFQARLRDWLEAISDRPAIADRPNA